MTRANDFRPNRERLAKLQQINLRLAALGHPVCSPPDGDPDYLKAAESLLKNYQQQKKLLADYRCPADQRIQNFLNRYLADQNIDASIQLPGHALTLDQSGLARELSLPFAEQEFHSDYVSSFRVLQGVLHNPVNDRRTTDGVFHIVAGGLPVPADNREVPVNVYTNLREPGFSRRKL